jgi:lipopolysaccharide export system protein LptA
VRILTESTEIQADEVELYGEDYRFLSCRGNIQVRDEEQGFYLTCTRFYYDREEKRSRADGSPVMEDQRNEVVVRGGYLEHDEEEDITLVQVGVVIVSIQEGEEMVARSEFARFKREEEVLELSGMPHVFWKGDEYSAARIVIRLEPVEIELEGRVEGRVRTGSEDEQEQDDE